MDVRTHTGPYGVPTGPLRARRDPTGPRRTAGGTIGPRLIGAAPVWAACNSYWRSRCYLYLRRVGSFHSAHCRPQHPNLKDSEKLDLDVSNHPNFCQECVWREGSPSPLLCPGNAMSTWFGYSQSHSQLGSCPPWVRRGGRHPNPRTSQKSATVAASIIW